MADVLDYRPIALRDRAGRVVAIAKVSPEDHDLVAHLRWHHSEGYARGRVDGRRAYLHQVLMPGHAEVDHINGNGLDNRRSNLRPATRRQNSSNRFKQQRQRPTSSRYVGVSRHTGGKWAAYIRPQGRKRHLGLHADERSAALAYDAAARVEFGEFARLNFPGPNELGALVDKHG